LRRRRGLTGRPPGRDRLHISLNFLGRFSSAPPAALVDGAAEAAAGVSARPFVVALDRVQSWNGDPRPLVMIGDDGVIGVINLHAAIHAALTRAGLAHGPERAITPHLTLLRDQLKTPEEAVDPIRWTVRDFALVHSRAGEGRHHILGRWTLGA
jgi:2'-5' RNA ligase